MLRKKWFWLVAIFFVGFIARLVVYGFIKLPWILYDEVVYLDTARQIVRGSFVSALTRDQLYPIGWPLLSAAWAGFIQNPFWQYKAMLILNMVLSSFIPVFAYMWLGNIWVSLLVSFFPPLFVYSSSIMSETFFTFILFVLVSVLYNMTQDDMHSKVRSVVVCAVVFGFLLYFFTLIRSFGIIALPSFIVAASIFVWYERNYLSQKLFRNITLFCFLAIIFYALWRYVGTYFIFTATGHYETENYYRALQYGLSHLPLTFRLLRNEIIIILVSTGWFLPLLFIQSTYTALKHRAHHETLARFFVIAFVFFSLGLTVLHMLKNAYRDPQYFLFSRYIDPALTVLFVFSVYDFFTYVTSHRKINKVLLLAYTVFVGYFLWYFKNSFYFGSYKYGNTMPVFFLNEFKRIPFYYYSLIGFAVLWVSAFLTNKRRILLGLFVIMFILYVKNSLAHTVGTPGHVQETYTRILAQWQSAIKGDPLASPVCLYNTKASTETYYMYHFLYPYRYLKDCTSYAGQLPLPRYRLVYRSSVEGLDKCRVVMRFTKGDILYYCPQPIAP